MTDIKEPINTTSDGTFLSVVCENPKKVLLAKIWGGCGPPSPPRNYPPGSTIYTGSTHSEKCSEFGTVALGYSPTRICSTIVLNHMYEI